jgi:hypothetical protein
MTDANSEIPLQSAAHDPRVATSSEPLGAAGNPALREQLHYRRLEQTYYQSAQYAAMVERYPLLRSSIAACRSMALVSDAAAPAPRGAGHLHWQRSHGEG